MKILSTQFEDTVDLSGLALGDEPVTVSTGTVSIPGGKVFAKTDILDPEVSTEVPPHTHPAATVVDPNS